MSNMTDIEKLIELLGDFYGVDPAYFGVEHLQLPTT